MRRLGRLLGRDRLFRRSDTGSDLLWEREVRMRRDKTGDVVVDRDAAQKRDSEARASRPERQAGELAARRRSPGRSCAWL
jgi:hypothetical protein